MECKKMKMTPHKRRARKAKRKFRRKWGWLVARGFHPRLTKLPPMTEEEQEEKVKELKGVIAYIGILGAENRARKGA
jgi:hypothetical protein